MIALSPLLEVFRDRYSPGNISAEPKSSAFTLGVIEKIVLASVGSHLNESEQLAFRFKLTSNGQRTKGLPEQFLKTRKLTNIQLLETLEECIIHVSQNFSHYLYLSKYFCKLHNAISMSTDYQITDLRIYHRNYSI
jgi:hypothetical protein